MSWFQELWEYQQGRNPGYRPSIGELNVVRKLDEMNAPHQSNQHYYLVQR